MTGQPEALNDPRALWVMVRRPGPDDEQRSWLDACVPMISEGYRTRYEVDGTPSIEADAVALLRAGLADFRAGWPRWRDTDWADVPHAGDDRARAALFADVASADPQRVSLAVAAYLGVWLGRRILDDAALEHGGAVSEFEAYFDWALVLADEIVPAVDGGDPEQPLHADHPLLQAGGRSVLPNPQEVMS
ncbi:hypothetical protein E1091_05745 [Micromonospora fluostatini]|uniref:Uncharacterized protein n=1 Tax=Micromonospora fluostatini TaxID=1629071 RepID=A0ABY2DJ64_9ACTN|nr:hypothetical protein E1091_05745 [Micromonospora fluostatini]